MPLLSVLLLTAVVPACASALPQAHMMPVTCALHQLALGSVRRGGRRVDGDESSPCTCFLVLCVTHRLSPPRPLLSPPLASTLFSFLALQCLSSLWDYQLQKEKNHVDFGLCCAPQCLARGLMYRPQNMLAW